MKIIALLPVKNEAWVLRHCLQSLSFCDEIIAIDDNSTDTTRTILKEFNCTIIPFKTDTAVGWSEYAIRNHLLQVAREQGATHIVAIDGDEMFSDAFVLEARTILSTLQEGESLSLSWLDIKNDKEILTPTITKVFACADNRTNQYQPGFIHIPRVPDTLKIKELALPYAVIHFQHLNQKRHEYKKIWYMMSEFEKGTRSALRINTTYHSINYTTSVFDISTVTSKELPNAANDTGFWQQEKVFNVLAKRRCAFFEPLDIWYLSEMRNKFLTELNREPRPKIAPGFLKFLNYYKNKIVNFLREQRT